MRRKTGYVVFKDLSTINCEIGFYWFERGVTSPAQTSFLQLAYGQIVNDDITVQSSSRLFSNVVDPHHFDVDRDADPDSTYHHDADPDSKFLFDEDLDADPDPTFRPDADPDPDPSLKKAETLEKVLK